MISKVLRESNISYIKWDMNRSITECYSKAFPKEQQGEVMHRYILGVYDLYERLINEFPKILFESCSSGGGRFDPGMLYYAPQAWASDDSDAIERLKIQYGTSMVYPISSIGAHVSEIVNQQVFRNTPIETRANVAYFGAFGYELDLNELTEENVRGMRVVKTYAREDYQKEKFAHESGVMGKGFEKVEQIMNAVNPAMQAVMYMSMCLILFLGSMLAISQGIEFGPKNAPFGVGNLSAMITYSAQVLSSLMMVAMVLFMIIMSVPAINRVYEVLMEVPSIKNNDHPIYEVSNGDIDFEDVSFKYKPDAQKYALKNINLHIKSGQTVGIIGGTGSSKSTLVNLISRFYDTSVGMVKVGGVNVQDYDVKTLRDHVAMVLQKNILFSGTIKDNLKWGNADATDEQIKEACKIAQADAFVEQFPQQYDSWIEQGGVNVSGGQRQRLCIARALLKNPKILILDDSTSAVDTKTDAYIRKGFKEFIPGITKIIIAQRVSSVQDADFIIVMDNGEINGIGTHEELLKNNAIYQEVYEIQNRIGKVGE